MIVRLLCEPSDVAFQETRDWRGVRGRAERISGARHMAGRTLRYNVRGRLLTGRWFDVEVKVCDDVP